MNARIAWKEQHRNQRIAVGIAAGTWEPFDLVKLQESRERAKTIWQQGFDLLLSIHAEMDAPQPEANRWNS